MIKYLNEHPKTFFYGEELLIRPFDLQKYDNLALEFEHPQTYMLETFGFRKGFEHNRLFSAAVNRLRQFGLIQAVYRRYGLLLTEDKGPGNWMSLPLFSFTTPFLFLIGSQFMILFVLTAEILCAKKIFFLIRSRCT